jgi:hypothetical protein
MTRLMRTDELCRIIMRQHGIYNKPNLRMMVEGMLYRMRVSCPGNSLKIYFPERDEAAVATVCEAMQ